jgi:hypothetical protein
MCLALNIAKMAKGRFSPATIQEMQYLNKKPRLEFREEIGWGGQFPGYDEVKAAIGRHPATLCQNHMDGSLPGQNGTTTNLQICWRRKGLGASPSN